MTLVDLLTVSSTARNLDMVDEYSSSEESDGITYSHRFSDDEEKIDLDVIRREVTRTAEITQKGQFNGHQRTI